MSKKPKKSNKTNTKAKANPNPTITSSEKTTPQKQRREYKAPPWEVLPKNKIESNAEKLKKRRDDIKKGIVSSSSPLPTEESNKADISRSNVLLSTEDRMLYNWKPFSFVNDIDDVLFNGPFYENSTLPSVGIPEVAFFGRSNVGKSSLLNALLSASSPSSVTSGTSSNNYARVGKTPGATASINFYTLVTNKGKKKSKPLLNFVDLPGFGYAKLSKDTQSSLGKAMQRYINQRKYKQLALGILLLDIRRTPTEADKEIINALYDQDVPICMVATKIDKLKNDYDAVQKQLEHIEHELDVSEEDARILPVSSVKRSNVKELWRIIMDACHMKVLELRGEEIDYGDDQEDDQEDYYEGEEDDF